MEEKISKVKEEFLQFEPHRSMNSSAKTSSDEPEVSARERQLQDDVKRWQAQTQALQQEDIQLKTELAAALLAARKTLTWIAPGWALGSLLVLTAPYYAVYKPAADTADVVIYMIAFIAVAAMILEAVSHCFRIRCNIGTGNAVIGSHVPWGPSVCGKLVSTPRSWCDPKPKSWGEEYLAGRSELQAPVESGDQLAKAVVLQIGCDNSISENPSQELAVPKCSTNQLQEQAQAWQVQQQALYEEEVNARLKSDLAGAVARSTGSTSCKYVRFIMSVGYAAVLQIVIAILLLAQSAAWPGKSASILLSQCFCAVLLLHGLAMAKMSLDQCEKLSDTSKQLSPEVAICAASEQKCPAAEYIQMIHRSAVHWSTVWRYSNEVWHGMAQYQLA